MAAFSLIKTHVFALSDPANNASTTQRNRLDAHIYFEAFGDTNFFSLFANLDLVTKTAELSVPGSLYIPDLDPSDPCVNASRPHIPQIATRKGGLWSTKPHIAFAPWISVMCAKFYLAAITDVTSGFLTYLPDNGTNIPPLPIHELWNLHDGGQGKAQKQMRVYVTPGSDGAALMHQLGQYWGNSSSPILGRFLALKGLDPVGYVRLSKDYLVRGIKNEMFWDVSLLTIVIAYLLTRLLCLLIRWAQRRERRALRRRIENGKVDPETPDMMRLQFPQRATDSIQTSISVEHDESGKNKDETPALLTEQATSLPSDHPRHTLPACAFCLEVFKPNTTTVRPLPCQRIYHPACLEYAIVHLTLNVVSCLFLASRKNIRLLSRHWICVAVSVFCIMTLVLISIWRKVYLGRG